MTSGGAGAAAEAGLPPAAAAAGTALPPPVAGIAAPPPGAGAAGGLAGGLLALGARAVGGAAYVAAANGLAAALVDADLVVTGEGRLDATTLDGKVVRHVLDADPSLEALVVVGSTDVGVGDALAATRTGRTAVVTLSPGVAAVKGIATEVRRALAGR